MFWAIVIALFAGAGIATLVMGALASGAVEDVEIRLKLVQDALASAQADQGVSLARERKLTAQWRDRALLCEEKGPTVGEVDEVFKANVRLKARVAVLSERLGIPPEDET